MTMRFRPSQTAAAREERFEHVYRANYEAILGYARRRAGSEEAADVVAETFLVAWRRLDSVPDGEVARLWLYGTARRVLANHERARRRRGRLDARLREAVGPAVGATKDQGLLAAAFNRVPAQDREVLALAAWEGLDAKQLATVLGCSANAARIRLHRARRRLGAELERAGWTMNSHPLEEIA
jgi:RNA polymerase sigma factor (sigma-70 family)